MSTADSTSTAGAPIATSPSLAAKDQPAAKPERRELDEKEKAPAKTEDKVDRVSGETNSRNTMDAQVQIQNQAQNQMNSRDLEPGSRSAKRAETSKSVQGATINGRQTQELPVDGR